MSKSELARSITQDLIDNDALNVADYMDVEVLKDTVADLIMYRLEDYSIVRGEIF